MSDNNPATQPDAPQQTPQYNPAPQYGAYSPQPEQPQPMPEPQNHARTITIRKRTVGIIAAIVVVLIAAVFVGCNYWGYSVGWAVAADYGNKQINKANKTIDDLQKENSELKTSNSTLTQNRDELQKQVDGYVSVPRTAPDTMSACKTLFDNGGGIVKDLTSVMKGFQQDSSSGDAIGALTGASLAIKKINAAYPNADPDMKAYLASLNAPLLKIVYATQDLGYGDETFSSSKVTDDLTKVMNSCIAVGYKVDQN